MSRRVVAIGSNLLGERSELRSQVLRVAEIKEGKQRTFDEVKADIRKQIENERVAEKIQESQNNIDDNRLAGKTLKEISDISFPNLKSMAIWANNIESVEGIYRIIFPSIEWINLCHIYLMQSRTTSFMWTASER